MSEYITPVYDRVQSDVEYAKNNPDTMSKGAYNYTDLNRIENNTRYVADMMLEKGITDQYISFTTKTDWSNTDVVTREQMNRIINNVLNLQNLSVAGLDLEQIYTNANITYELANAIEYNLDVMLNQELPADDTYSLTVNNGTGSGYYTEGTVVNIVANLPEANQTFFQWSGEAECLARVADPYSASTTYTMWHTDDEITATYHTGEEHVLRVIDGTISEADSSYATYYSGDTVTIIADAAPTDKVFYEWTGDYSANCDNPYSSTTIFTMPDVDVEITANFIYPLAHILTVSTRTGTTEYALEYKDVAIITATGTNPKYTFSYWSYTNLLSLANKYGASTSVVMGDLDATATANYAYEYGECVVTVNNGTGSGTYTEGDSVNIRIGSPLKSDAYADDDDEDNYYFRYWSWSQTKTADATTYGNNSYGRLAYDGDVANNLYVCCDGTATFTPIFAYAPYHTITFTTCNGTSTYKWRKGTTNYFTAPTYGTSVKFSYWVETDNPSVVISTDETLEVVIGNYDLDYTAVYKSTGYYTLTCINCYITSTGETSGSFLENTSVSITGYTPTEAGYDKDDNYYNFAWDYGTCNKITNNRLSYGTSTNKITIGPANTWIEQTYKQKATLKAGNNVYFPRI